MGDPNDDLLINNVPTGALSDAELSKYIDEEIPEDKINELNAMFEKFKSPDIQKQLAETSMPLFESDDIDSEIKRLLALDEQEEVKLTELNSANFIEDVSVYDTEDRSTPQLEEIEIDPEKEGLDLAPPKEAAAKTSKKQRSKSKAPKKNLKEIPTKRLYYTAAVLGVLVLGLSLAMFKLNSMANDIIVYSQKISIPSTALNNAQFIYVSQEAQLNGNRLALKKILLDALATEFYFESSIDLTNYTFTLKDNQDNYYPIDLVSVSGESDYSAPSTKLRFAPLDAKAKSFSLKAELTNSDIPDSHVEFSFYLDGKLDESVRYLTQKQEIATTINEMVVAVEGASFSAAGSTIFFSFRWKDDKSIFGFANGKYGVSVSENGSSLVHTKSQPHKTILPSEKMLLGRANFAPTQYLTSTVFVNFQNLERKFLVNQEYPISSLPKGSSQEPMVLDFERYKVIIEGARFMGDYYVLVFHTEDKEIFASSSDLFQNDNRVDTTMDASLEWTAADGLVISVPCKSVSGKIGTDVLFDLKDYKASLAPDKMKLKLNSLNIQMKDISIPIDLSNLPKAIEDTHPLLKAQQAFEETQSTLPSSSHYVSAPIGYYMDKDKLMSIFQKGLLEDGKITYRTNQLFGRLNGDQLDVFKNEGMNE